MAAGKPKQFLLLLWKNFIIQKRKKCCTIFEILIPLLLVIILVLIRLPIKKEAHPEATVWNTSSWLGNTTEDIDNNYYNSFEAHYMLNASIAYAPKNALTDKIMADAVRKLGSDLQLQGKYIDTFFS